MYRSKLILFLVAVLVVGGALFGAGYVLPAARAIAAPRAASVQNVVDGLLTGSADPVSRALSEPPARALAQVATQVAPTSTVASGGSSPAVTINIQPGADAESQIMEAVYQKVNPSVVKIYNLSSASSTSRRIPGIPGLPGQGRGQGQGNGGQNGPAVPQSEGSGFVWDSRGNIVTNDHVVEGADKLQVVFADGTQVDATLVGTDPDSDLAVVRVDPSQVGTLVPVEPADMSLVKVGQRAIAIGNPFGFQGTMTQGIVSALGRSIPSQTNFSIPEAIQTDAAINPGNSGGPLLNSTGQVIGVNDQIQSDSGSNSGVGFAIPISIVQRVVPALVQNGQYQHSYLGISGNTYSKAWAQALGFPADARGAYVMEVAQGGPAAGAGLVGASQDTNIVLGQDGSGGSAFLQKGGDLITAIDGKPVTKMDDLLIYLEEHTSPGQTVKLSVLRANGSQETISVKLGARPNQ